MLGPSELFAVHSEIRDFLEFEWSKCEGDGSGLAALAIEIDQISSPFRQYGAKVPETFLPQLLPVIGVFCGRTRDRVFQVTREQFLAVLPATHLRGAKHVALRIIEGIAATPPPPETAASVPGLTASIGVAVTRPPEKRGPGSLVEKAERALVLAQEKGGNCYYAFGPTAKPPSLADGIRDWVQGLMTPGAGAAKSERRKRW